MSPTPLPRTRARELHDAVRATFVDAGCSGWVHALTLAPSPTSFDFDADTPVVLASVYKLPLMISLCRMTDHQRIDLRESVTVDPTAQATGTTGLAALHDPVTISWRDLATSMMTVSDNAAADVILDRVGLDTVLADLDDLGLDNTRIVGGMAELHARLRAETGTTTVDEAFAVLADPDRDEAVTAYDAAYSSASTPRDCTALLDAVWSDRAASPVSCAFIRATMRKQVFTSRLASGFAVRGARVAGKTGTLAAVRNEIGVVEFSGEYPVAVAVFTKSARTEMRLPVVDRAIGEVARLVVTRLRRPLDAADTADELGR
ncbi:serine hydrolase [Gordonia polyisoprenivorans]|uniref:serine hydrolase n=1 Tax=Gordonia polyisoprenivorans TaxID=84595 RepID=UPI002300F3D2|nr:serine hydrolase [Gordonia polyisoprenivorans]WCB37698.1 class A beta-lactamase-related serine hydrolase [Gordonia polyisoprenivorans]